jgi:hypothetical protein
MGCGIFRFGFSAVCLSIGCSLGVRSVFLFCSGVIFLGWVLLVNLLAEQQKNHSKMNHENPELAPNKLETHIMRDQQIHQ